MQDAEFCYWLQGFFEIGKPKEISSTQLTEIKNHLNLATQPLSGFVLFNYDHLNDDYRRAVKKNWADNIFYC